MSSKFIYYVYAYLRSKDSKTAKAGTPYYIGMGSSTRAYSKDHSVNLPKEKTNIVIVESRLSRLGAAALERRLIRWYGKISNQTGILRNIADGGEGGAGNYMGRRPSDLTKNKISKTLAGRKLTPFSEEHRRNISKSLIGRVRPSFSDEWRNNLGAAAKGKQPANTGLKCWNDGTSNKFSESRPGENWVEGMVREKYQNKGSTGMKWWNNGTSSKLSISQPGPDWSLGRRI